MCINYKCQSFGELNFGKCPLVGNKECAGRGVSNCTDKGKIRNVSKKIKMFDSFFSRSVQTRDLVTVKEALTRKMAVSLVENTFYDFKI